MKKGYLSQENREFDIERFNQTLEMMRKKLDELEKTCIDDDILRDAVIVAVEGYCKQLDAIRRACDRSRNGPPLEDD